MYTKQFISRWRGSAEQASSVGEISTVSLDTQCFLALLTVIGIQGILCTQEWQRFCTFFCMIFKQPQLLGSPLPEVIYPI
jgi:hypothetical protein